MTEQQSHLQSALTQQKQIAEKISSLNNELAIEREKFIKLQGIVEYLNGTGVRLPETTAESAEESAVSPESLEESISEES